MALAFGVKIVLWLHDLDAKTCERELLTTLIAEDNYRYVVCCICAIILTQHGLARHLETHTDLIKALGLPSVYAINTKLTKAAPACE